MLKQVSSEELIVSCHYFRSLLKPISSNVCIIHFVHSFIFMPAVPLGMVAVAAAPGVGKTPHSQQQSQVILLTPH